MFPKNFKNKVIVVTGAGMGIGKAVCKAFAKQGAHLVKKFSIFFQLAKYRTVIFNLTIILILLIIKIVS